MENPSQNLKTAPLLSLRRFHISEDYGFLLPNPLMPLLNCRFLRGYREQRLAHLVLSVMTMGYVWQRGENQPQEVLPRNLAIPLVEVSRSLGLPPILVHSDLVLTNWTPRNPERPLEIGNLDIIVSFPGGESLRGFILVTVLVEKAAVPGIKALVQAVNAILQCSQNSLLQALQRLKLSIQDITRTLGQMHDYVDPDIFYAVIRIFLSGWKDNPAMPVGLIYEGVSTEPLEYSGGSAAQSTVLHAFDEFLGVCHSKESADFLHRMREYMPPSHKAFIEEIHSGPSLRDHILSSGNGQLLTAYNQCVEALADLRSYHITVVTKYLIIAATKAKGRRPNHLPGPSQALEERGTGGTEVLSFLKSVRDKTLEAILHQSD
ncbi:indoleamine 2,3-dioxygenase 2 isoform X1 [Ailuropoda melanoleuca]|uniref:indoleamine 2,3-dioxygenase 2 isoform X1 n=1 Tax=Ailuropoda melanoleuca TaxID=9646 RepID=UPI001494D198|nr:indoleamine 2,3-dioxygenase 2 isoform X1 [Ailuropoda melanoleuca]